MGDTSKKGGQTCVLVILRVSRIKHTEADGGRREGREKNGVSVHTAGCRHCIVISRAPPPAHPPPSRLSQGKTLTLACLGDVVVVGGKVVVGGRWGGGGDKEEARN